MWFFLSRKSMAITNNATRNLNTNLRKYVSGYINARNRNNKNTQVPLNAQLVASMKKFINSKRPRVAGAVAAAVGNAGGNSENAAKAAQKAQQAARPGANPVTVGLNASKPLNNPNQVTAAAAAAAKQQALNNGLGTNEARQAGENAAAQAAQQARPNATPVQQAQTAAAGAAAANVNAERAALSALLNASNINSMNNSQLRNLKTLLNTKYKNVNNNRKTSALARINELLANIPGGSGGINLNSLKGAVSQNTNGMNSARAKQELLRLNAILKRFTSLPNNLKNQVNNYRRRLLSRSGAPGAPPTRRSSLIAQAQRQQAPEVPLQELNIEAPNGELISVTRVNNETPWNFKFKTNKSKYKLVNVNKNTPRIENSPLFEQAK